MTTNQAGLRRSIAIFVVAALADSVGTGTYFGGAALYFTRTVGLTVGEVALGLTVSGLLGLIATMPWGHAAHRFGGRRVYLILMLARGACFAAYALVHSFLAYLLVACLLGLVDKPTAPVQQELVALVVRGEDRQRALGWIRSTRNLGFVLGSGAAGLVTLVPMLGGYRSVVLVNAASFVVAAALAALLRIPSRSDDSSQTTNRARPAGLFRDRRYLAMTVVNGIVSTHMALLSSGLPLWIVTRTSLPAVIVPILTGVNAAVTMLLQVPVAKGVRTTTAAAGALLATGGLLAGCCFTAALLPLIAAPAGFGVAVVSVLFLTAAELAQSVGGWKLSYDLAPEAGRAIYLARFSLGTTIQQLGMPLVLTALVFPTGVVGWLALAGFLVAGGAAAPIVLRLRPSGSARNCEAAESRQERLASDTVPSPIELIRVDRLSEVPTAPLAPTPILSEAPRLLPCGHEWRPNARFCSVCGAPVPS